MEQHSNAPTAHPQGCGDPDADWQARIARAELMGRKWGVDTPRRLHHHLKDWDDCPRKRLCLAAAARVASRA